MTSLRLNCPGNDARHPSGLRRSDGREHFDARSAGTLRELYELLRGLTSVSEMNAWISGSVHQAGDLAGLASLILISHGGAMRSRSWDRFRRAFESARSSRHFIRTRGALVR